MTPLTWRDSGRWPGWLPMVLVLVAIGLFRLGWDLYAHWDQHRSGEDLRVALLLGLRGAALASAVVTLSLAALRRAPASTVSARDGALSTVLRGVVYVTLTALAVASLAQLAAGLGEDRFAVRSVYRSALLAAASVWTGLLVLDPGRMAARPRGPARLVGIALVNLLVALAALEAVALLFAHAFPTRLLWNDASARSTIEANRLEPGSSYLGFPANSEGYYDDEFFPAGPDDFVVALLADSFGVGIVRQRYNFATVAERRLAAELRVPGRVAVHNFGIPAIGMPEYAWLLERQVAATSPTRIVLGLFVGNDISGLASRREHGLYSLQQLQLFELAHRLRAIGRDRPEPMASGGRRRGPTTDEEGGTFDRETFLDIELAAAELCNTRNRHMERLYRAAFRWLERLHRQAGDRLLVVLIPDEYQVNDELYAALMQRVQEPASYDRLYPQKRLAAFCEQRGIEVLDLLPELRRANSRRPVYRLRDTHWNAHGNRIAGEAIARHLIAGAR